MGRQCNHCSLRSLRREAKKAGERVTVRSSDRSLGMGGVDVYVHPAAVKLPTGRIPDNVHDAYFRAWFMEVTESCAC